MSGFLARVLLLVVVSSLAACGGGGGGNGTGGNVSNGGGGTDGGGLDGGGTDDGGTGNGGPGGGGTDDGGTDSGGPDGGGTDDGGTDNGGTTTPIISLDKTIVTLTEDRSTQAVAVTFGGDKLVVSPLPDATVPRWLSVYVPAGSTSPATVTLSVFDWWPPGRYATTLRFATSRADGSNVEFQDVNVTYTADHLLSPAKISPSITAGAIGPGPLATLSLVTDGATWEATSDQSWLTVTPASGVGSATLNASVSPSLASGQYTGTITVRDTLTNRTRTTKVDLAVNPRRLAVQPRGVALTSTAGHSVLTRTVKVIDTGNLGGRWTASDDAPWLQLAPSSDGSSLTLTADDTGLTDDIHYATVTIAPDSEPGFSNTTQIKVGLYVDHTSPAPPATIVSPNIVDARATVADPIRPYVYVAQTIYDGTSNGFNGAISTYNYYTGQLVEKLDFPHRMLTDLEVSPDGGLLLAADVGGNGNSSDCYINPIELSGSSRILRPRWGGIRLDISSRFKIAEIGGTPVVLTGEKQIVSITDGAVLGDFESDAVGGYVLSGNIAVSPDGGSAIVMGTSTVNHRLARYRLTQLNGTFRALETKNINEVGNGEDVASDPVGNRFITLSSNSSDSVRAYDVTTLELTKSANTHFGFTGNLDVAANSDIYVTDGLGTFSQYDSNFLRRGARTIGTQSESTFGGRLSGDGQRAVVGTVSTSVGGIAHLNFFDSQLPP